jgi:hypothetical protein
LFTLAVVVLTAGTLHATGAYLACSSTHFRGFAPVGGLLGLGSALHVLPMTAGGEQGMKFLAYLSPWGALDGFFWHEINRSWSGPPRAEFCGSEMLVFPFVLAAHVLLFVLLVRAASRKLERPEQSHLPPTAWMVLWAFALATAMGASLNRFRYSATECWACAAGILGVSSAFICGAALLDHPHRREVSLAAECERVAAGGSPRSTVGRLAHAFFVAGLALLATILVIAFACLYRRPPDEAWGWLGVLAVLPAAVAFLASLALEFAFIGFASNWARASVAAAAYGLLAFCAIAPAVDVASSCNRFRQTMWAAHRYYALPEDPPEKPRGGFNERAYFEKMLASPEHRAYAREIHSLGDADRIEREYGSDFLRFFWGFHPLTFLAYVALALANVVALAIARAWAYRSLRREAERAAKGGAPRDGPVRLQHVART